MFVINILRRHLASACRLERRDASGDDIVITKSTQSKLVRSGICGRQSRGSKVNRTLV